MSYHFGLYFGNTNLCIAVNKEGITDVLANAAGDRVTPSYVAFANGEKLVGLAAKQGMVRNANNTVTLVKSILGGDTSVIDECKCSVVDDNGLKYELDINDKQTLYTPFDALSTLLKTMAIIAKSHCHEVDIPVVVTVPLNFSFEHCEKVKSAVIDAGFRLLRLINEPSAAALAHDVGQDPSDPPTNCIIYRMGGTSLDVSVIRVINGIYHVLSTVRKRNVNGNLFTQQLVDFCATEFQRQYKGDIKESKRSVIKVQSAAETCKHTLSSIGAAQCFAESVFDGIDLSMNISRARFESLIGHILPKCTEPVEEALKEAGLTPDDIGKLIFAGGSCKVPKLQQILADIFPSSTTVMNGISPDEVIAIGAAKEAVYVPQDETVLTDQDCQINILSLPVKANINAKDITTISIFPGGTPIPASFGETFSFDDNVAYVDIYEEISQDDKKLLAKLPFCSAKDIILSAHLSKEGILKISCSDKLSQLKKTVTIMPTTD